MKNIRLPHLPPHSLIDLVAPSSPPTPLEIQQAIKQVEALGFKARAGFHTPSRDSTFHLWRGETQSFF